MRKLSDLTEEDIRVFVGGGEESIWIETKDGGETKQQILKWKEDSKILEQIKKINFFQLKELVSWLNKCPLIEEDLEEQINLFKKIGMTLNEDSRGSQK